MGEPRPRVALLGAREEEIELLAELHRHSRVELAAVYDPDPHAPGLAVSSERFELEQALPHLSKPGPLLYVFHPGDEETLAWLRLHYPSGRAEEVVPPSGRPFMTFVTESLGVDER